MCNYVVKQCVLLTGVVKQYICVLSSSHLCLNLLRWTFYNYKEVWEIRFAFKTFEQKHGSLEIKDSEYIWVFPLIFPLFSKQL